MPFMINIVNMKINSVSRMGNVSPGATFHNSHTANTKFVGTNLSLGDFSATGSINTNGVLDSDIGDQGQVGNPSTPISNQL